MNNKLINEDVLLIGDDVCADNVGIRVIEKLLTIYGISSDKLFTAIVSNNFDRGNAQIFDTSDILKKSIEVWNDINLHYGIIASGYILNKQQGEVIYDYIKKEKLNGSRVIVDPIMGDEATLYPGMNQENIQVYRKILSLADVCTPNFTEVCFLAGVDLTNKKDLNFSKEEVIDLLTKLDNYTSGNIVITSVSLDNKKCVIYKEKGSKPSEFKACLYLESKGKFAGAGDAFTGSMIANFLKGNTIRGSVLNSVSLLSEIINKTKEMNRDSSKGLPIENLKDLIGGNNEKTKTQDNLNRSIR